MNREQLRQIIIPNSSQIWICLTLSLITLLATFKGLIFSKFFHQTNISSLNGVEPYLQSSYNIQLGKVSQLAATDLIVKAVFFAGIGLIAYVIFLAISNVIIEARNEVVIETEYTNKGQADSRVRRPFMQIVTAVMLFVVLLASAQLILPLWLNSFQSFLLNVPSPASFILLVVGLVGLAVNIYTIWSIAQIVFAID
ncbi:MAG TPA: hypothetical protein VLF41_02435 [Candidatus Nanoarchaeia archaeon]|nr:hypothetical protein [Candidatus Nanoarchaeia archaeon]